MERNELRGRRVLVPGGTGTVGAGVVRAFLDAGAEVAVATRSRLRGERLAETLDGPTGLHLLVGDPATFSAAAVLVGEAERALGGLDDVVAPVGGLWSGRPLQQVDEQDWADAFTALTTAHMAVARAALPLLGPGGAYTVVIGRSAEVPVPGLGLVSMEQAAVLMMQRVLAVEAGSSRRIHALVLGRVRSRDESDHAEAVSADQVGRVAVALAASRRPSGSFPLHDATTARAVLADLAA